MTTFRNRIIILTLITMFTVVASGICHRVTKKGGSMSDTANKLSKMDITPIKKSDLIHGEYYLGDSDNNPIAIWNGDRGCFFQMMETENDFISRAINHCDDPDGTKTFTPIAALNIKY